MAKSKNIYQNRKSQLMMLFMSFQMNFALHLTYTLHHLNEIIIFVRRNTKRETNKLEASNSKFVFFPKFLALKFCSTSPPGGNQVDGLPPVVKFRSGGTVSMTNYSSFSI